MPKNSRGFAGSVFADLLPVVIGALTGNPALGALFGTVAGAATGGASGALKGAFGGFGAGGGFDPITDKIKGFVSEAFGGGGFSNPTALGLEGSNLALPGLANAPAATPVAGYGAGALSTPGIAAGGALGLSPSLLYNPKALAAPTAASTPRTPNVTTLLGGPAPAVAPTGTTVNSSTGAAPRVTALGGGAPQRGVTEMGFGGVTRGARQAAGAGRTASNTLLGG